MPFPSARTAHEAKTKIRELTTKALGIIENPSLDGPRKKAAVAPLEEEIKHWQEEATSLEYVDAKRNFYMAAGDDPAARNLNAITSTLGTKTIAAPQILPSMDQAEEMFRAIKSGQNFRVQVKDASTDISGTLPPQLVPGVASLLYEPVRLMDKLPVSPMNSTAIEFLVHTSTTGTATMVDAGGLKPLITPIISKTILQARKIAVGLVLDDELFQDFAQFVQYMASQLNKTVIDAENAAIMSGDGTGINLLGLLNVSGLLTRAYGAGSETNPFDTIELAIQDLRIGPAYTDPSLVILHPTTWSKIRRTKDSQGRYLAQPDPTAAEANKAWGVDVATTTTCPVGTAVIGNMAEACTVFVREGLNFSSSNSNNDNFQRNQTMFLAEERVNLGVQRPAALVKVTGL